MTDLAAAAAALPAPSTLRNWVRARAVAEVCRSAPDRWGRMDSFERRDGWEVFVSRNGAGDELSVTFAPEGAVVRVFNHESEVSPYAFEPLALFPGLLDTLPQALVPLVFDPAFDAGFGEGLLGVPAATLYLWRLASDPAWRFGSAVFPPCAYEGTEMLGALAGPDGLAADLSEWGGVPVPLGAVEHLCAGAPLTQDVVSAFGERLLADVLVETVPMGYPTS